MAEVLGIVASGLAVQQTAGQIAKSLIQLRRLWDQIQDAPEEIQDLMADIACFAALLTEMEGQLVDSSPIASQSLQLCRNALRQLEAVVSALELQLASPKRSKRLMGALKVVVRRQDLKRYEARLERAFRLLQMSHQCYISASTKLLPDVIAERISVELHRYQHERLKFTGQTMISLVADAKEDEEEEPENIPHQNRISDMAIQDQLKLPRNRKSRHEKIWSILGETFVIKASTDSRSFGFYFQPPMIQRIWNIQATQTYGGWQYVFRRRGYISYQLEECLNEDNDTRLLRLFESGQGSPYDLTKDGDSIYTMAASRRKFGVMTMLLKSGLVEDCEIEKLFDDASPTNPSFICGLVGMSDNTGDQIRLLHSLGCQLEWEHLSGNIGIGFIAAVVGGDAFQAWQRLYFPQYHRIPSRDRFLIGRYIATRPFSFQGTEAMVPAGPPSTESFTYFIERTYETTGDMITQSADSGLSLLGSVAYAFGWRLALCRYESAPLLDESESEAMKWQRLAQDLIQGGSNFLHPSEEYIPWSRWQFLECHFSDEANLLHAEWSPFWALFSAALMAGYRNKDILEDSSYGAQPRTKTMKITFSAVRRWLDLLHAGGVDLEVYGAVEKRLVSQEQVTRDFVISLEFPYGAEAQCYDGLRGSLRVISLDIGPTPQDWRIWWAFEYEIWAQEFWEMVENTEPELTIPGGWVD